MNELQNLGFIGGGNMATAVIGGLLKRGWAAERMVVADPSPQQRERLARAYGVNTTADNVFAAQSADVLILAIKPQQMRAAAMQVSTSVASGHPMILSVAAGITQAVLSQWLGAAATVVRCMPNQPALEGFGATGLYAPASVGASHRAQAERIMGAVGCTVWVDNESQMDTVTALSGSGPAYFFLLMEALEAAAVAQGLPRDIAHRLTVETAFGGAQLARNSDESLSTLREQVTSKGGTTAAALAVFDKGGLRAMVSSALLAAERRSAELAVEFGTP